MSIYIVRAGWARFSAEQLHAINFISYCGDLGGMTEGVAWVRDNDGDIIILAVEYRPDSFFRLLPRRYLPYAMDLFYRAAVYLTACATDWLSGPSPLTVGWGVTVEKGGGGEWLMSSDADYTNQKALNVDQGKLNIQYNGGDENERS
jgi:hypothetical protein|nr:MAG TPA: hypothetical protein [Caudoviricetes sp.]